MGLCNCSMFCYALLCVHSSFTIISMRKRELVALPRLSSWCLVIVVWLCLTIPRVCLQVVIVVFPDHTHLLFVIYVSFNSLHTVCNMHGLSIYQIKRYSIMPPRFSSSHMKVISI